MKITPGWPPTLCEPDLLGKPVVLRSVRARDARAWRELRLRNAEWIRPWEPADPESPRYRSSITSYLAMTAATRREALLGKTLRWSVTFGDDLVGQVTISDIVWGSKRSGELGAWIDQRVAGYGIMPLAAAMAVDHCFRVLGLHRIVANIRPENTPSRKGTKKLGFREEGLHVAEVYVDGLWRDHVCYALTAEEVPDSVTARVRSAIVVSRSGALTT